MSSSWHPKPDDSHKAPWKPVRQIHCPEPEFESSELITLQKPPWWQGFESFWQLAQSRVVLMGVSAFRDTEETDLASCWMLYHFSPTGSTSRSEILIDSLTKRGTNSICFDGIPSFSLAQLFSKCRHNSLMRSTCRSGWDRHVDREAPGVRNKNKAHLRPTNTMRTT